VSNKLLAILAVAILAVGAGGCNTADNANTIANANAGATATTTEGPDNSQITTTTDAAGVKTETRVFRNNPRVSRVVVTTTPAGQRTVRVYSTTGEEKIVDDLDDALDATGETIARAAGWTADKAEDAVDEVADKAEDVGDQTVKGAKTVGKKTTEGAKKAGKAIKDAVTP
jgi:hypothetical protein